MIRETDQSTAALLLGSQRRCEVEWLDVSAICSRPSQRSEQSVLPIDNRVMENVPARPIAILPEPSPKSPVIIPTRSVMLLLDTWSSLG